MRQRSDLTSLTLGSEMDQVGCRGPQDHSSQGSQRWGPLSVNSKFSYMYVCVRVCDQTQSLAEQKDGNLGASPGSESEARTRDVEETSRPFVEPLSKIGTGAPAAVRRWAGLGCL